MFTRVCIQEKCSRTKLISRGLLFQVFGEWNKGELDSFLIEITRDILAYKDKDGQPLLDKIRDSAGQVCAA